MGVAFTGSVSGQRLKADGVSIFKKPLEIKQRIPSETVN